MTRIKFENSPSTNTPINAENLNKLNNVIVSSKAPTTGEEVWIERSKNLISSKNFVSGVWNTAYTIDDNDKITVTIPKETTAVAYLRTNSFTIPKGKHTFSAKIDGKYTQMKLIDVNNTSVAIIDTTNTYFTTNFDDDMIVFLYIYMNPSSTSNVMTIENIQLEQGELTTTYEPFTPKKIHTKNDNGVYEEFYNEEEQLLKSCLITETVTLPEITINTGTRTNTYKSVAKDGYKPLGIIGVDGTNDYVSMCKFLINRSNDTAYVTVVNSNANSQTTTIKLLVLYIKN